MNKVKIKAVYFIQIPDFVATWSPFKTKGKVGGGVVVFMVGLPFDLLTGEHERPAATLIKRLRDSRDFEVVPFD